LPKESDLSEIKRWLENQKEVPFEEKLEDKQPSKNHRLLQLDVIRLGKRLYCEKVNKRFTEGNLLVLDPTAELEEESVVPPIQFFNPEFDEYHQSEDFKDEIGLDD